jgi:hypothetical protein
VGGFVGEDARKRLSGWAALAAPLELEPARVLDPLGGREACTRDCRPDAATTTGWARLLDAGCSAAIASRLSFCDALSPISDSQAPEVSEARGPRSRGP